MVSRGFRFGRLGDGGQEEKRYRKTEEKHENEKTSISIMNYSAHAVFTNGQDDRSSESQKGRRRSGIGMTKNE